MSRILQAFLFADAGNRRGFPHYAITGYNLPGSRCRATFCLDNRETGVKPVLPPQRLADRDASLSHCEQSWEGDAFGSVSPDTGLDAGTVRFHRSGNAAGGAWTADNDCRRKLAVFVSFRCIS